MLEFIGLHKMERNHMIIPSLSMTLQSGKCTAIQCTREASEQLMAIMQGNGGSFGGQLVYKGTSWSMEHSRRLAAFVLHSDGLLPRLRVNEYLKYWQRLCASAFVIEELLSLAGLIDQQYMFISDLNPSQRKRLQLARCVLQDRDIIILEEPDQNMDQESLARLGTLLDYWRSAGKTLLLTTTSGEQASEFGDVVYRLHIAATQIIAGTDATTAEEVQQKTEESVAKTVTEATASLPATPVSLSLDIGKIPAKSKDRIFLFNAPEINYVESKEGSCLLYVDGVAFACTLSLSQLEERLRPFGFFRCHRSYLVNLQQVREIEAWTKDSYIMKLEDEKGTKVPLSKNKFNDLKELLGL